MPLKQRHDFISRAIICYRILIEALRNLSDGHLYSVVWCGPDITLLSFSIGPSIIALRYSVPLENFIDGSKIKKLREGTATPYRCTCSLFSLSSC